MDDIVASSPCHVVKQLQRAAQTVIETQASAKRDPKGLRLPYDGRVSFGIEISGAVVCSPVAKQQPSLLPHPHNKGAFCMANYANPFVRDLAVTEQMRPSSKISGSKTCCGPNSPKHAADGSFFMQAICVTMYCHTACK